MKVLTGGPSAPNVGTITAVAAADATVTAQIGPVKGQTLMAIYGVPSTQNFYMTNFSASVALNSRAAASAGAIVRSTMDVENDTTAFIFKHTSAIFETGSTTFNHAFGVPKKFEGPCIIKLALVSGDNDTHGDASFDGILVDN